MSRLTGKVVLVTGASRGLGASIASRCAAEGAIVLVGFRRAAEKARSVVESIVAEGGRAEAVPLDVREGASIDRAFAEAESAHGRIDVLVNNAAVAFDASLVLVDEAQLDDVVATNLRGTLLCCRAAARTMRRAKQGNIVNVASTAGMHGVAGQAAYSASKGGVLALTRTLARELGPAGIRVNAIAPGYFDAGMVKTLDVTRRSGLRDSVPLGRLGHADECARAVVFLASDDASYVNGHTLVVDGGLTA